MKKIILLVTTIAIGTAAFSQEGLTSKKGEAFLPEEGDWAIGFDATPFIEYIGNLASGNDKKNTLSFNNNANTFYGKFYKTEKLAYRGLLRIGFGSTSTDGIPVNENTDSSYVNSTKMDNGFTFIVGGGLEKRKGKGRLQGFYGGQLFLGKISNTDIITTYGKELSASDPNKDTSGVNQSRTLEENYGNTLTFGLQGFLGVEYFILPKFSLGAEVNWGLNYNSTGESNKKAERWGLNIGEDPANIEHLVEETFVTAGSSSGFTIDNSVGANFILLFHF